MTLFANNLLTFGEPILNIKLYDVTLRDGLQDLEKIYTLDEKITLLDSIIKPNIQDYEIGSFPNLKFVPQMCNSLELYQYALQKYKNENQKTFYMLIFNNYGLNECIKYQINHISFITSYCETFIKKNINKSKCESLDFIINSLKNNHHITSKVYVSAFCGSLHTLYNKDALFNIIHTLYSLPVKYITLSDTYSLLTPQLFENICIDLALVYNDFSRFSLHIHKNNDYDEIIQIALRYNIHIFDVSHIHGGGCTMIKDCVIGENLHINDIQKYL